MIFHFHDYGRKGNASCQVRIGKKPDCFGDVFFFWGGSFVSKVVGGYLKLVILNMQKLMKKA